MATLEPDQIAAIILGLLGVIASAWALRGLRSPIERRPDPGPSQALQSAFADLVNAPLPYLPLKAGVSPPLGRWPSGPVRCACCGATGRGGQDCDHCGNPLLYPPPPSASGRPLHPLSAHAAERVRAGIITAEEARREIGGTLRQIEDTLATLKPNGVVVPFRGPVILSEPRDHAADEARRENIGEREAIVVGFPRKQSQGRPPAPRTVPIVKPEHIRRLVSAEAWERFADDLARHGVAEIEIERAGRIGRDQVCSGMIYRIEDGPPTGPSPERPKPGQSRPRRSPPIIK